MTQGRVHASEDQPATTVVPEPRRRVFRRLTLGGRLADFAWRWVQKLLFHHSPGFLNAWRRWLLRRFGAGIDRTAVIHPSVRIVHPWNLTVEQGVVIFHNVVLDCQAPVSIGRGTRISQFSHLCTATHDYRNRTMPIIGEPITIGKGCWLAADVFVGSGVIVGDGAVVGARASVFCDIEPGDVVTGSPARHLAKSRGASVADVPDTGPARGSEV